VVAFAQRSLGRDCASAVQTIRRAQRRGGLCRKRGMPRTLSVLIEKCVARPRVRQHLGEHRQRRPAKRHRQSHPDQHQQTAHPPRTRPLEITRRTSTFNGSPLRSPRRRRVATVSFGYRRRVLEAIPNVSASGITWHRAQRRHSKRWTASRDYNRPSRGEVVPFAAFRGARSPHPRAPPSRFAIAVCRVPPLEQAQHLQNDNDNDDNSDDVENVPVHEVR
jgi:hypothetical protein